MQEDIDDMGGNLCIMNPEKWLDLLKIIEAKENKKVPEQLILKKRSMLDKKAASEYLKKVILGRVTCKNNKAKVSGDNFLMIKASKSIKGGQH